jgi:hypothetical protein
MPQGLVFELRLDKVATEVKFRVMELNTLDIMDGTLTGDTIWVCHYNRPDLNKKPLRNVPPTLVKVRSIDELPKNKTVYYSKAFLSPISKSGKLLSRVISPVDNTGYRSRHGDTLHAFTGQGECLAAWRSQIHECIGRIDVEIESAAEYWKSEKSRLELM